MSVIVRATAACAFAVRVVRMPVRQLRNDSIRRQDGETEESRCSKVPRMHEYRYRKSATRCQIPNDCIFMKLVICCELIVKVPAFSQLKSGWPLPRWALFMRHPGFGSNEAPALNAPRAIILWAHFANRQAFFANFAADRFAATGSELHCGRGEGLCHRPSARIGRGGLSVLWRRCLLCRWLRRSLRRRGLRSSNHLRAAAGHAAGGDIDGPKQISPVLGHHYRSATNARNDTVREDTLHSL
jgi:hypothetical protein